MVARTPAKFVTDFGRRRSRRTISENSHRYKFKENISPNAFLVVTILSCSPRLPINRQRGTKQTGCKRAHFWRGYCVGVADYAPHLEPIPNRNVPLIIPASAPLFLFYGSPKSQRRRTVTRDCRNKTSLGELAGLYDVGLEPVTRDSSSYRNRDLAQVPPARPDWHCRAEIRTAAGARSRVGCHAPQLFAAA